MTRERERESERVRKEVKVRDENLLPRSDLFPGCERATDVSKKGSRDEQR